MENTIENPLMWFVKKWNVAYTSKEEQDEFADEMIEDLAKITSPYKDEIESVKIRMDELHKKITDLRRALSECKAKARIRISPENR